MTLSENLKKYAILKKVEILSFYTGPSLQLLFIVNLFVEIYIFNVFSDIFFYWY